MTTPCRIPLLPTRTYAWEGGGTFESYGPTAGNLGLTTGFLTADTFRTSDGPATEFAAWEQSFFQRLTQPLGIAETILTPLLLHWGTRRITTDVMATLMMRGTSSTHLLFAATSTAIFTLYSGAMSIYQLWRQGQLGNGSFQEQAGLVGQQLLVSSIHSSLSSFLGMGLLNKLGGGKNFLRDCLLELPRAVFSVVTDQTIELLGGQPQSSMSFGERCIMSLSEGAVGMVTGRGVGLLLDRPHLPQQTPSATTAFDEDGMRIHFRGEPDPLDARAFIRSTALQRRTVFATRLEHYTQSLDHPASERRGGAVVALGVAAIYHPGTAGRIREKLTARLTTESDDDVKEVAQLAVKLIDLQAIPGQMRKATPPPFGPTLERARKRSRLSRTELAKRTRRNRNQLWTIERDGSKTSLETVYRAARAIYAKRLRPRELASLYEAHNDELRRLPFYDRHTKCYQLDLPDGIDFGTLLATPLHRTLQNRLHGLRMTQAGLARLIGVDEQTVYRLLLGRNCILDYDTYARVAVGLEMPESLVYLLAHKEIPDFVKVVNARTGETISEPTLSHLDFEAYRSRVQGVGSPSPQERLLTLAGNSRGKKEAIHHYVKYDATTGEPYLEIPPGISLQEISEIGLYDRLRGLRRFYGEESETYLGRFGIQASQLTKIGNRTKFPLHDCLGRVAHALELPEEVLVLKLWPELHTEGRIALRVNPELPPVRLKIGPPPEREVSLPEPIPFPDWGDSPPMTRAIGDQLIAQREQLGMSRKQFAKMIGVTTITLQEIEQGSSSPITLTNLYQTAPQLERYVEPQALYLRYAPDIRRAPFFDWKTKSYLLELPAGMTLEDLMTTSPAVFLWRRAAERGLTTTQLATAAGLSPDDLVNIFFAHTHNIPVNTSSQLAGPLAYPASLVHLVLRKEITDFWPIHDAKSGAVLSLPDHRYDVEKRVASFKPGSSAGERRIVELTRCGSRGVKQVVWKYMRLDPQTNEPYLELPSGYTTENVRRLDLDAHIDQGRSLLDPQPTRQEYLERAVGHQHRIYYELKNGKRFPEVSFLEKLANGLGVPVELIIARYWPRSAGPLTIRAEALAA